MTTEHGKLPSVDVPPPSVAAYIAAGIAVLVLVLFGLGLFGGIDAGTLDGWLLRIGAFLLAAGVLFVAYAAWRRNRPGRLPGIAEDSISYTITRLAQRRDALSTAWIWMLLPLVPGMALLYAGAAMVPGIGLAWSIAGLLVAAIAFGVIAAFTVGEARKLDAQIAELERQRSVR